MFGTSGPQTQALTMAQASSAPSGEASAILQTTVMGIWSIVAVNTLFKEKET